jgi:hypothetical protein
MKATTTGNPKWKDIKDAYKLKHDVEERCVVCGAEISHMNKEMCKNSHMQKPSIPTNAGDGLPQHWKEKARKNREMTIRKDERYKVLDEVNAILAVRKMYMEELFDELRDPAVAKHSLQQIEIIRWRVNELRDINHD